MHIYNLKTCYLINGSEAILVLFRQGVSFHVSLAQFCIFLIQSCIEITLLWTRVWHNMMHRCLIPNMITIFRYFDNVLICLKMSHVFVITATTTQNAIFRKLKSANNLLMPFYINQPVNNFFEWCFFLYNLHAYGSLLVPFCLSFRSVHIKKAKFEICSRMFLHCHYRNGVYLV